MKRAIGIDFGGTSMRIALVGSAGEVIEKIKLPSEGTLKDALDKALEKFGTSGIKGIGIGCAGIVRKDTGEVVEAVNLPNGISEGLSQSANGLPVKIENDAAAAALGEHWVGAAKGIDDFVMLTLGTGIGCGLVHGGKLLHVPAELGHTSINHEGPRCPCGNNGCLEQYSSARAITDALIKALEGGSQSLLKERCQGNIYKITPEDVYKCAFDGDPLSRTVLRDAGRALGAGMANIINLMGPKAIVLAGGLTGAWELYAEEAIREAQRRSLKSLAAEVTFIKSALGDDAGVIGAAGLILHHG